MTTRNRMTWQRNKKASPPPASYGWTPEHPAFYPDPEADKYENGDTSSWAEDPTKGPYPQGPAPASQSWVPSHPAAKADAMGPIPPPVGPDAGKKAAALRQQVEKKAAKCIRVASAILGKGASVQAVENKAMSLMDLPDRKIDAALVKMRQAFLTGEGPIADDLDGDGFDQNDPEAYDFEGQMDIDVPVLAESKPAGKYAEIQSMLAGLDPAKAAAISSILASDEEAIAEDDDEAMLAEMLSEPTAGKTAEDQEADETAKMVAEMMAGKLADDGDDVADEDEALLAEMMSEADEDEALLAEMMSEAKGKSAEGPADSKLAEEIASLKAELASLKAGMAPAAPKAESDMMGLAEDDMGEDPVMAMLFGKAASKGKAKGKAAEEDDKSDEGDDDPKASKKASLKALAKLAKKLAEGDDEGDDEDEGDDDPKASKKAGLKALAKMAKKLADDGDEDDEGEVEAEDDSEEEGPKAGKGKGKEAYQSLFAADDSDDSDDDGEVEAGDDGDEDDAEAKKEARLHPQPRKASGGVKALGAVRTASVSGGSDLSKLWKSAPDVSDHF